MIRVYQYRVRPPHYGADLVTEQLRLTVEYRNQLTRVEHWRRDEIRRLDATPAVEEALTALRSSGDKDAKKKARQALLAARREARSEAQLDVIAAIDKDLCKTARGMTSLYWGSYLDVEAAHQQTRKMPLYKDDLITPNSPRFVRDLGVGQIGVQIQKGLTVAQLFTGTDQRARIVGGILWLRVGSNGRAPVWAKFVMQRNWVSWFRDGEWVVKPRRNPKRLRVMPNDALIKWIRVSRRYDGPWARWSVEFTLDIPAEHPHDRDQSLNHAVAIEPAWDKIDGRLVIARWRDSLGGAGVLHLVPLQDQSLHGPTRIEDGIRKPDRIRSVRDRLLNEMRPQLKDALARSVEPKPTFLLHAFETLHEWKSPMAFYRLYDQWIRAKCDSARRAFEILDAWRMRDSHLWEYETGARQNAIRWRKDVYHKLAARFARRYKTVILDDRNFSREARWGEASDNRFTASPFELRECFRNAFGSSVVEHEHKPEGKDERPWCERAIEAWLAGGARAAELASGVKLVQRNAWASRKAKKGGKATEAEGARELTPTEAE